MPAERRRELVLLVTLTVIAFLPRLWFWRLPHGIDRDGVWYASLAESLAAGRGFVDITGVPHAHYPPGFPAAIALLVPLLGDGEAAGRMVSLIVGTLTPALTYLIGRRLASRQVGIAAAFLMAFQPRAVYLSTAVLADALQACLLTCVTLAALGALRTPGMLRMLGVGVTVGLLACVRTEGYVVAAAFFVAAIVALAHAPRARAAAAVAAFVAGVALPVAPYAVFLRRVSGDVLTGKWGDSAVLQLATTGGMQALRLLVGNVFKLEGELASELSLVWIALALVGGVLVWTTARRPEALFVTLVVAFTVAAIVTPLVLRARYIMPLYPLLFVTGALALERLHTMGWRRLAAAIAVVVALHFVPGLAYPLRFSPWNEPQLPEQAIAGRWVRDTLGPGRRIMSFIPNVAYYAKGQWVLQPFGDVNTAADAARRAGVDLLVVDDETAGRFDPRVTALLSGEVPPSLRVVQDFAPYPGRRVRVLAPR